MHAQKIRAVSTEAARKLFYFGGGDLLKQIKIFFESVLAGICIGIGGTVFLSVENRIVGAFLFAIGLFVICTRGFALFTGKVGYIPEQKPSYVLSVLVIWAGNFAGTWLTALLIRQTRISGIAERAEALVGDKLADTPLSILILSFFCGLLMYIGVDGYKTLSDSGKYLSVFMAVSVFILCGFEHCIANMFYFSLAGSWSLKTVGYLLLMTLGNAAGGMLLPLIRKITDQNPQTEAPLSQSEKTPLQERKLLHK